MAIASLIIGITLFLNECFLVFFRIGVPIPFGLFSNLVIGIVGLVLAILAIRKETRRRIAIAGIVLNSLAILWFTTRLLLLATGT